MKNPIDSLFDENNNDVIVLYNEFGEEVPFEQVALIPLNDKFYAILCPINLIDGVDEDEGLVFVVSEDEHGQEVLELVVDTAVIDEVFAIYDDLCEEATEE